MAVSHKEFIVLLFNLLLYSSGNFERPMLLERQGEYKKITYFLMKINEIPIYL